MAKIKPFSAFLYNQELIPDLSKVVCPPYDIIGSKAQEYYHAQSPYNIVHLILGKDIAGGNKYIRARQYLKQWMKDKIFIRDVKPAIYFYLQQYNIKGEKKTRLGFIALLSLDEKGSFIFPHEHTRIEPKEDRLKLLKAVKANLSPIFVLFRDEKRIIRRIYEEYILAKPPFIEILDDEKTLHRLWRIEDPKYLNMIQNQIDDQSIFIADGHHPYEVALLYRDQMSKRFNDSSSDSDYIMAYFTNVESKGLLILPIHRFVKEVALEPLELQNRLKEYFDVEEIKDMVKFFFLMEKSGLRQPTLGLYKDKRFFLLRLRNIKVLDKIITDKPKEYRQLDVSILNYIILKKLLDKDPEDKEKVIFSPDTEALIQKVNNEKDTIAFFLNAVKVEQALAVAFKGERLPPKTTYFYPKVLSGLVINKFR